MTTLALLLPLFSAKTQRQRDKGNGEFLGRKSLDYLDGGLVHGDLLQQKNPMGRKARLDLPDRSLVLYGFRVLALMEAEADATVQRQEEARTAQLEEMGGRE